MTQPTQQKTRRSRDDLWPLRNADGLTFAQAKALRESTQPTSRNSAAGSKQE